MNYIKGFITSLLILASVSASALEVTVNRVLEPVPFILKDDKRAFSFMREVCTDTDIVVKVFKKYRNRESGEVIADPYPSEYEYKHDGKNCDIRTYTVLISSKLEKGVYEYIPRAQYTSVDGSEVIDIPNEIFVIK